ncbi:succinate dehydrogenase subunit 3 [Musa troglodytarum]|nr:succinate dehydrogenase subunit 3 [Musa troglodytarum]
MSFPRGSSRHSMRFQPRVVPHQTRAFHGSRAVSVSAKGVVANRLLSPHLPVKKPQLGATFSISHRIFGASLGTVIVLTPLLTKFSAAYNIMKHHKKLDGVWIHKDFMTCSSLSALICERIIDVCCSKANLINIWLSSDIPFWSHSF